VGVSGRRAYQLRHRSVLIVARISQASLEVLLNVVMLRSTSRPAFIFFVDISETVVVASTSCTIKLF